MKNRQRQIDFLRDLRVVLKEHEVTLTLAEFQGDAELEFNIEDHSSNFLADTMGEVEIDCDYITTIIRKLEN